MSTRVARSWLWISVAALVMAFAATAQAQIPRTLGFQGFLVTSGGQPVSATLAMTFKLYGQPAGGAPLWTESQQVAVANGAYSVTLGSIATLSLPFDAPYYLGITVGADAEMTPRQALSSAPYALKAGCFPGDRLTCFTPGGQPGAGCSVGTRFCDAQGTGYGPCLGEVTPNCNGNCVNFSQDVNNCGSCGNACASGANSSATCSAGTCALACSSGFGNCDGNSANGCETSLGSSVSNCGTCGRACATPANGTAACSAGTCGIGSCNSGYANCDGNSANGCETNLNTSSANCGACGRTCPVGSTCVSGTCV